MNFTAHCANRLSSHIFVLSPPAVKRGDRVAQLILERIMTPDVVEVAELDDTSRGANGYGSTGGHATL